MKIVVLGSGYVGLVAGACFANIGINVVCIDHDVNKISKLQQNIIPIYEPGLDKIIEHNIKEGNIIFDHHLNNHLDDADAVFLAVGTPSKKDSSEVDLSYITKAAKDIMKNITRPIFIVIKSTVPVGTNKYLQDLLANTGCEIISNPEFLREGYAIDDFMNPDRVVVGVRSKKAHDFMEKIYQNFTKRNIPVVFTSPESAELIKYGANAFLATKIAFINEISDLCEKLGADIEEVSYAMGLDSRIGSKFLKCGPGYGGSCFPKDTLALSHLFHQHNFMNPIIDSVISSNFLRKKYLSQKIIDILGGVSGKIITCFGASFKNNTDDVRDSAAIEIIKELASSSATIRVFDPQGNKNAKEILTGFDNISYLEDGYEATKMADALIILTEWEEFKQLDYQKIPISVIIDYRNLLNNITFNETTKYYRLGN